MKCPNYFSIHVKGDSPIKKSQDLKRARIGTSRMGGASHGYSMAMVKTAGLEKDVRFVAVGRPAERVAALVAGAIEAFVQTFNRW